jgi:YHS domain-containing protein
MLRLLLLFVLALFLARAFWRVIDGVREGLSGSGSRKMPPAHGVRMVRDPVCGTYVIPDRAVTLAEGSRRLFFCSETCRDKYRERSA